MKYGLIITLAVILAIVIAILVIINIIRNKIRDASLSLFGTSSLLDGINDQKLEMSETPRSLHAMTSVFLPQIQRDFPEFDYPLYKNKTQSLLRSYFSSIQTKIALALAEEYSLTLKNQVQGIIEDLNSRDITQIFNQVVIHNTEIARYIKNGATVTIQFVSAVGYITYGEDGNGNVVFGNKDIKQQTIYETELVYVQDVDKVNSNGESLGINCPNCGAPVKNLGVKFCEYCGTSIKEVNIRAWKFDSVKEQTVQKKQY